LLNARGLPSSSECCPVLGIAGMWRLGVEKLPQTDGDTEAEHRPASCRRYMPLVAVVSVLVVSFVLLTKSMAHSPLQSVVEGEEPTQAWRIRRTKRGSTKRTKKTDAAQQAQKVWDVISGKKLKFTNKPRVRREWRTLSETMKKKVAAAYWTLKTLTTAEGQAKYGPNFHNHDDMLMLHACATTDPRCDEGHFGPQFMTFHRALLLKYELALMSVDKDIEAMPYWNIAYDAVDGKYRHDPMKYIFTDLYFGNFFNVPPSYAVTNGLFANWPIAHYSQDRFGSTSALAKISECIKEEYFVGTRASVCDKCCNAILPCECEESDTHSTYLRAHDDCTPVVARNPYDDSGLGELDGTYEISFTEDDFHNCTNVAQVRTWMEWQDCIEMGVFVCSQRFQFISNQPGFPELFAKRILPLMAERVEVAPADEHGDKLRQVVRKLAEAVATDAFTNVLELLFKGICQDKMLYGFLRERNFLGSHKKLTYPRFFHSQAHIKFGKDMLDVTTSPNEAAGFTGYHADIDRSSMTWMINSLKVNPSMEEAYWLYPPDQKVTKEEVEKGNSEEGIGKGISGPFALYDILACANNTEQYYEYRPFESPWLPGTILNDVVNSGFPFKNLFTCDRPQDCDGGCDGYTHKDILYYTAPGRTPYTYDTLEHYYYD